MYGRNTSLMIHYYASLPNSAFGGVMLVAWDQAWWEYLHGANGQALAMMAPHAPLWRVHCYLLAHHHLEGNTDKEAMKSLENRVEEICRQKRKWENLQEKKKVMRSGREKRRELELFGDTDVPIKRIWESKNRERRVGIEWDRRCVWRGEI